MILPLTKKKETKRKKTKSGSDRKTNFSVQKASRQCPLALLENVAGSKTECSELKNASMKLNTA
jgi:hypothetical protein